MSKPRAPRGGQAKVPVAAAPAKAPVKAPVKAPAKAPPRARGGKDVAAPGAVAAAAAQNAAAAALQQQVQQQQQQQQVPPGQDQQQQQQLAPPGQGAQQQQHVPPWQGPPQQQQQQLAPPGQGAQQHVPPGQGPPQQQQQQVLPGQAPLPYGVPPEQWPGHGGNYAPHMHQGGMYYPPLAQYPYNQQGAPQGQLFNPHAYFNMQASGPAQSVVVDGDATREAKLQISRNNREIGVPGTAVPGELIRAWLLRHNSNTLSQVKSTVAESPGHPSFQTVYQVWTADKTSRNWTKFFLSNPAGHVASMGQPGHDILIGLAREYLQLVASLCEWTRLIEGGHTALEALFSFDGWFSVFGAQIDDFEATPVKDMKKWLAGSCALTRHLVRPAPVVHVPAPVQVPLVHAPPLVVQGAVPVAAPVARGGGGAPRGGAHRGGGGRGRGGGPNPLWPLHVATHLIAARARPAVTVPPTAPPPGCCFVCHGNDHFANAPCPN